MEEEAPFVEQSIRNSNQSTGYHLYLRPVPSTTGAVEKDPWSKMLEP